MLNMFGRYSMVIPRETLAVLDSFVYKSVQANIKLPLNHIYRLLLTLIFRGDQEISNKTVEKLVTFYIETLKQADDNIQKGSICKMQIAQLIRLLDKHRKTIATSNLQQLLNWTIKAVARRLQAFLPPFYDDYRLNNWNSSIVPATAAFACWSVSSACGEVV